MSQTKFAKSLALSVGVLVFSGAISYLIFAWTAPSSTPPEDNVAAPINTGSTPQTKAGKLNISRDNSVECCSGGDYTLSLAENTKNPNGTMNSGRRATIQFHNGFEAEGYLQLNSGSAGSGYEIKAGSYQTDMALHATGVVKGAKGLCIGNDCRATWATSCDPDTEYAIGINADGTMKCKSTGGTPPWNEGKSCNEITDSQLAIYGYRRVFVTSSTYSKGEVDNITNADNKCNKLAHSAGYSGNYKALVYIYGQRNPYDVLNAAAFRTCGIVDGKAKWFDIASSPSAFLNTSIAAPIKYSQLGTLAGGTGGVTVWTGFNPTGGGNITTYPWCYISPYGSGNMIKNWGSSTATDVKWAFQASSTYLGSCNDYRALYCVQYVE